MKYIKYLKHLVTNYPIRSLLFFVFIVLFFWTLFHYRKSIINIFILATIVLNFSTAQTGIPKRGYAMDWVEPLANSNPSVMKMTN